MNPPLRLFVAPRERLSVLTSLVDRAAGERRIAVEGEGAVGSTGVEVALLGDGAGPTALRLASQAARTVLDADAVGLRGLESRCVGPTTWCSLDGRNPLVADHLQRGGDACLVDGGTLWLCAGPARAAVASLADLPFASGGAAHRRLREAILFVGAAVALDLSLVAVRSALTTARSGWVPGDPLPTLGE
jgi:hypothetical protein